MKKIIMSIISFLLLATGSLYAKTYDLVLIHGLGNKHPWSDAFLNKCLEKFGSGNVYAVYTNTSTTVWTRTINGRTLYCCGPNDYNAGDDYIYKQAQYMKAKIDKLQGYGLSYKFNVIAHSMGGMVTRRFIYDNPYRVAGLITLATPHHGSQLADDFEWAGFFIGATNAISDLRLAACADFNVNYPVIGAPLADGGKVYTIQGDADGWDCWGWGGELAAGWEILQWVHGYDNDGLVARGFERIDGATHIATYWDYDHKDLTQEATVADKACSYLR